MQGLAKSMKFQLFFLPILLMGVVTACTSISTEPQENLQLSSFPPGAETWAFQTPTDRYSSQALLDLRYLNEKVAGESGFIRLSSDGDNFVRGDGKPIRFWAVNSSVGSKGEAALKDNARFLAKRGVNMVRWHGQIPAQTADSQLTDINTKAREELWQYVAAMKQQGVYITISPYYAMPLQSQANWGIPRDSKSFHGLLFFDPELQSAYKNWLREMLQPVNPYTGVALKDEPAIALIQLQNEDSLLFWTVNNIKGRDLDLLSKQFADWLRQKYGSLAQASATWQGTTIEGDDFDRGLVRFYNLWEMTQNHNSRSGKAKRLADQTQFWTETMYRFNAEMTRFLRSEIGAKQLINAGNWKTADPLRLYDAERYSYTPSQVIGVNKYYHGGLHQGKYQGWAIVNGDKFSDRSMLFNPRSLPTNLKQVASRPMIISEGSWVPPLGYQSEAPFLMSVFQSLTGVDGFYWFSSNEPQWRQPSSANGYLTSLGKWVINTPELMGNFPAAALMYRLGYIQPGKTVIHEHRTLKDLWQRRLPIIAEDPTFDPNRDKKQNTQLSSSSQRVNPLAFLVGSVKVSYSTESSPNQVMDLSSYIDEQAKVIRSVTGEVKWDYGRGICTLDAPKVQGVTGFLKKGGQIKLKDTVIASGNDYATVIIVSMDNQPLKKSAKVLIQVGTVARPTGWKQKPVTWKSEDGKQQGFEIVRFGQAPWRIIKNDLNIIVNNPQLSKATVLDANGLAQGKVDLKRDDDKVSLQFPPNAKYLILE